MARYLTFDLGTTLYKVALFDDRGRLLALERARPPINEPSPGRMEVRSGSFFHELSDATRRLKASAGDDWNELRAVSFATQANSFMLLGDQGFGTPLILWPDERAFAFADELATVLDLPDFRATTGMPRFSPQLALAKIFATRRADPASIELARQLLFISDLLTAELTNQFRTEAGVAGLSGALDITTLRWRADVLQRLDVPPIELPLVVRAGTNLGPLYDIAAQYFDLPRDCQFVVGCLDQYAGAIGTGAIMPGAICETTGTVLAAVRCADRLEDDPAPSVFQGPAWDEQHFWQMSFSSNSANLLEWYRNSLPDQPAYEELSRLAGETRDSDLIIEPFQAGKPIEHCFRNVRPEHTRGEVVRAIMHRVAKSLKDQVADLSGGEVPREIRSAGGAARSDVWLQIKADMLKTKFVAMECEEPTSLGAAMLAHHGVTGEPLESIAKRWVKVRATFEPRI
jgi:xylulokinase